jgi:hypothetical protein
VTEKSSWALLTESHWCLCRLCAGGGSPGCCTLSAEISISYQMSLHQVSTQNNNNIYPYEIMKYNLPSIACNSLCQVRYSSLNENFHGSLLFQMYLSLIH